MINIKNKDITIIGAGKIAFRKTKKLLEFGANVKVVGISIESQFNALKEKYNNRLEIINDEYNKMYILHSFLVIAATSSKKVNEEIARECRKNKILCNTVNSIDSSDFIVPSTIQRGDLVIAVSTTGKSPSLSSKIRKELEERYTDEYEEYVNLLGKTRKIIVGTYKDEVIKKRILNYIVNLNLDELRKYFYELVNNQKE
ncbi:bifunctional precorrin-2 dehydrogenase/sirohydrochlorin ferrochelatase [Haloimpatiens sp. FM7330]